MSTNDLISERVLVALRRITRTIDLHSRRLMHRFGLTVPQLLALQEIERAGESSVTELGRAISLSPATVAGIVGRLEKRGHLTRRRSDTDRRRVLLSLTDSGRHVLETAPSLLQETFVERLEALESWEQHQLLASVERLVTLMEAETVEAAPLLAPGTDASAVASPQGEVQEELSDAAFALPKGAAPPHRREGR